MFGRTLRLLPYFMWANSEGSGETAQMRRLAWAFAGRLCDKYHNRMSWLKSYLVSQSRSQILDWWTAHACAIQSRFTQKKKSTHGCSQFYTISIHMTRECAGQLHAILAFTLMPVLYCHKLTKMLVSDVCADQTIPWATEQKLVCRFKYQNPNYTFSKLIWPQ